MKKKENRKALIALIILAVIGLYFITANGSNTQQVSSLKDENLQLISASWEDMRLLFLEYPDIYKYDYNVNLKLLCERYSADGSGFDIDLKLSLSLPSDSNKKFFNRFYCKGYNNGKDVMDTPDSFFIFNNEGSYDLFTESPHGIGGNLKNNNQVTLCCDVDISMQHKVCKSLTVPPLCK